MALILPAKSIQCNLEYGIPHTNVGRRIMAKGATISMMTIMGLKGSDYSLEINVAR